MSAPGAHGVHDSAPAVLLYVPTGQAVPVGEAEPALQALPAAAEHAPLQLALTKPLWEPYVPALLGEHALAFDRLYCPAGHTPVTADPFPTQ